LLAWLSATDWRFTLLLLVHLLLFYPAGAVALAQVSGRWPRQRDPAPTVPGRPPAARRPAPLATGGTPPERRREPVSIAVVNINKNKYSETFIDELIPALRYRVLQLHGGELPHYDADDRHFLSNWPSLQALAHVAQAVIGLDEHHFLRNSIASYLQAQEVRLVLAHFGPVGVEMLPITRDLGIPLIVCFHAYDVFHDETRRRWAGSYPALFVEAATVIGVSEGMLRQLEALGAPRRKLVHLPAFVNLRLFPFADRSRMPVRFLAVGRFAETKSPHLTILAFHRVVQAVPEATLTMVGRSGGGELFEACLILVKSLGLEDRVTFKGVVSHQEVALEMSRARVFVQHSVTTPVHGDMEGKPVAVMEAMASGLPVVATRHSGIAELIEHGVTGLLVSEFDVAAMGDAMIRLAQDDGLVGRMGRTASAAIHQHPLISRHVEILEELIDRAIASG
jgi:glycosyltransferase involved in cell wall biosynthesis